MYQARDGTFYSQPTDTQDQEEEYEVDQVLEYDEEKDMYLVSWKNYGAEDNQWEPSVNLENAQEKVNEYWEKRSAGATVPKAIRIAHRTISKAKRTSTQSHLMKLVDYPYWYPSDGESDY